MFQPAPEPLTEAPSGAIRNLAVFQTAPKRACDCPSFVGRNMGMFQARTSSDQHVEFETMRTTDIQTLFDFTYWANRQVLGAVAALPADDFARPLSITYRNLRGTLVHTLDVELSWRRRLRGEPKEAWDVSLAVDDYPTVDTLAEHWSRDEAEMRAWLGSLSDDDLVAIQNLGNADRFPLWYYLVHIVTHSEQQRRDVQIILENLGHLPPDLEFLYYADSLAPRSNAGS